MYLTLVAAPRQEGVPAVIGVVVQPLVMWLWVGGALMALGTGLAAASWRRRRSPPAPLKAEPRPEPVAEVVGVRAP